MTVAVAVRTGGRRLSQWLLPATATPTARQIYVSRGRKDAGPGVHLVSPGLLQLAVLRHRLWFDEPAAVCPECGCTSGVGCTTVRPHHADATGAALASGSTSGGVQDCHSGLPLTVRHGPSLSGRRLSVGLRRRSPSPAFSHIEDECCQTELQQLWRQVFCGCSS